MSLHRDVSTGNVHVVHNWTYADQATREAASLLPADVGKVAWQLDDDTFWILKDDSPLTWVALGGGGSGAVDSVNGQTGVVVLDPDDLDDTLTTNKFTTTGEITKLAGIEVGADVTDATNVAAAGAVMEADTSTASMAFVVDEDDMVSNSATKVPTQQSVKAYVDAAVLGAGSYDDEQARDAIGAALGDTANIDFTYDDGTDSITADLTTAAKTQTINFVIDGGGSTITTGIKGDIVIDYACDIVGVTMLADQTGSVVVDIWKDTYANYPPTDADSITAAAVPTISAAVKSQDVTLTGWTVAISAGDILRFNVDSVTDIQRVTVSLEVVRD